MKQITIDFDPKTLNFELTFDQELSEEIVIGMLGIVRLAMTGTDKFDVREDGRVFPMQHRKPN